MKRMLWVMVFAFIAVSLTGCGYIEQRIAEKQAEYEEAFTAKWYEEYYKLNPDADKSDPPNLPEDVAKMIKAEAKNKAIEDVGNEGFSLIKPIAGAVGPWGPAVVEVGSFAFGLLMLILGKKWKKVAEVGVKTVDRARDVIAEKIAEKKPFTPEDLLEIAAKEQAKANVVAPVRKLIDKVESAI